MSQLLSGSSFKAPWQRATAQLLSTLWSPTSPRLVAARYLGVQKIEKRQKAGKSDKK